MTAAIEEAGLWITDIEIKRLHYAETLKAWRERFVARWDEVAALYDERFCRMWEVYLVLSELSFRYGANMVIQVQLAKRVGAVPIVRDYMVDGERATLGGTGRSKPRSVA
jgi:cyclopropane-fatty-acyl-phospholipid synthase